MTTATNTRSVAIIGVVGSTISTKSDSEAGLDSSARDLLRLAEEVGAAIAAKDKIAVLTGGHHQRREASVKYRALRGAANTSSGSGFARLIGILPVGVSRKILPAVTDIMVEGKEDGPVRSIYFHTQLDPEQRNYLTGNAADVFIALDGGKGTLQEVQVALAAGRHVVFLKSFSNFSERLGATLGQRKLQIHQAENVGDAVEKALEAIQWGKPSAQLDGDLPDNLPMAGYELLKPNYELLRADYQRELMKF